MPQSPIAPYRLLFSCYLSIAAVSAQPASLNISSSSVSVRPGEQIIVTYSLSGPVDISAFQWDEALDSRLIVSSRELAPSVQAAQKELQCANQRCIIFGINQNLIPNGPVVVTRLTVSPTAGNGNATLQLQNLVAAKPNATQADFVAGAGLELQILDAANPSYSAAGIVNAATYQLGLVPGGLATVFGTGISSVAGVEEANGSLVHKGLSVSVNGRSAPLISVANVNGMEQINFQVPFEIEPGTAAVEVINNGRRGAAASVSVLDAQPGIFEVPLATNIRVGAIGHANGGLVSPENPANRGETVSLYLTGAGRVSPSVSTGSPGPVPPAALLLPATVTAGGVTCRVDFAGYAPSAIGLYQINFEVAADAPAGASVPVLLRIGERVSNTVRIAIQ
jgi:uncharacterized protein (TIGR03437 family)